MANQTFSLGKMLTRRGATAALTSAAIGASVALASFPAAAQNGTFGLASKQSSPVSLRDCSREKDSTVRAFCESMNRTDLAKARGAAAEKRGQAAQAATICLEEITKEIEAAKTKGPLSPQMKVDFKARIERCDKV
ncbi:MAG: hypothetical protein WDO17_15430 [Alphaproteobacteria bacterium]